MTMNELWMNEWRKEKSFRECEFKTDKSFSNANAIFFEIMMTDVTFRISTEFI